jgi:hypothetical protein
MFDRINWVEGRSKTLSFDGCMDLMKRLNLRLSKNFVVKRIGK